MRQITRICQSFVIVLMLTFAAAVIPIAPSLAAGTCTGAFPADSSWKPVRNTTGGLLTDPLNDTGNSNSNNSNADIYGTEATSSAPAGSAIDWYSNGNGTGACFQFRMRIAQSAAQARRRLPSK